MRGVGVSGQQHGMVPLDSSLRPIRDAKLWCDVEASDQALEFSRRATMVMSREWSVTAAFTAPKVMWMREEEPENWDRVRWVVLPHDYVNLFLRGATEGKRGEERIEIVPTTDAGDASGTGVLDPETREYVPALADVVDPTGRYLRSLPRILSPGDVAGFLCDDIRMALGVVVNDEVPISVGSGDNMCSALGVGCVDPGSAVLSLGTSGTVFGVSDSAVATGTSVAPFCDASGRHLPLVCVMSCAGVLQSVLDDFCGGIGHDEATELAEACPPGCEGLTFLPYLGGERTPDWPRATGALLGLNRDNTDCTAAGGRPGLIYRAALEGLTYLLADALRSMEAACGGGGGDSDGGSDGAGFQPTSLLVVGGGSKNRLWRTIIADVLGVELRFPREAESAALGAALQAGAAASGTDVGEFVRWVRRGIDDVEEEVVTPTTDEGAVELYQVALGRYRDWSRRLFADGR